MLVSFGVDELFVRVKGLTTNGAHCLSSPSVSAAGFWPRPLADMVGDVIASKTPQNPTFAMTSDPQRDNTDILKPCDTLALINSHEMDHRLRFEAQGHMYFFDDKKVDTSAT